MGGIFQSRNGQGQLLWHCSSQRAHRTGFFLLLSGPPPCASPQLLRSVPSSAHAPKEASLPASALLPAHSQRDRGLGLVVTGLILDFLGCKRTGCRSSMPLELISTCLPVPPLWAVPSPLRILLGTWFQFTQITVLPLEFTQRCTKSWTVQFTQVN